jgi:DEAD/DEAH box helicase domain-containing protein
MKTIPEIIQGFKSMHFYDGQLESDSNIKTFPNKNPIYGNIDLSSAITDVLDKKGISQLYVHQTEAIKGLYDGQHVIVSTSTAR